MGIDQSKEVNRLEQELDRKERELQRQRDRLEQELDGKEQELQSQRNRLENKVNRKEQKLQTQRERYSGMKRKRDAIQRERNKAMAGIGILSAVLCAVLICCTSRDSLVISWANGKLHTDATGFSAIIIAIAVAYCAVFAFQYGIYRLFKGSSKESSK